MFMHINTPKYIYMKYTLTLILSLCSFVIFSQQVQEIYIERMTAKGTHVPFEKTVLSYDDQELLTSEYILKWNRQEKMWQNYKIWKGERDAFGRIVQDQTKAWYRRDKPSSNAFEYAYEVNAEGKDVLTHRIKRQGERSTVYPVKNPDQFTKKNPMAQYEKPFFDKYNSIYTMTNDQQIESVAYDRCRTRVAFDFQYDVDKKKTGFVKTVTNQDGTNTIFKGTFIYPELEVAEVLSSSSEFNLFPNPSSGRANIKLEQSSNSEVIIQIENLSGGVIERTKYPAGIDLVSLDLSSAPAGIYLVRCLTNGKQTTKKWVITEVAEY